jgi:hypothetical protein
MSEFLRNLVFRSLAIEPGFEGGGMSLEGDAPGAPPPVVRPRLPGRFETTMPLSGLSEATGGWEEHEEVLSQVIRPDMSVPGPQDPEPEGRQGQRASKSAPPQPGGRLVVTDAQVAPPPARPAAPTPAADQAAATLLEPGQPQLPTRPEGEPMQGAQVGRPQPDRAQPPAAPGAGAASLSTNEALREFATLRPAAGPPPPAPDTRPFSGQASTPVRPQASGQPSRPSQALSAFRPLDSARARPPLVATNVLDRGISTGQRRSPEGAENGQPPAVHISIGRIEVRASPPASAPNKRPAEPAVMSLKEYLSRRDQGRTR